MVVTEGNRSAIPEEIEARLREFIEVELLASQMRVERDDDLLSGELLDSVSALRLATFVGETFGLTIEPRDFVVENFRSLAVLTEFDQRLSTRSD